MAGTLAHRGSPITRTHLRHRGPRLPTDLAGSMPAKRETALSLAPEVADEILGSDRRSPDIAILAAVQTRLPAQYWKPTTCIDQTTFDTLMLAP